MNKKFLLFLVTILIVTLYFFSFDKFIVNKFHSMNKSVQNFYIDSFVYISDSVNKYLNQISYIEQLKNSSEENQKYKVLYQEYKHKLEEQSKITIPEFDDMKNYIKVRILSYFSLDNHSKVVLNKNIAKPDEISALITYDGYSAGIVLNKDNKTVAYLNQNKKSNYTVYIGSESAPGITSGTNKNGEIVVKFVPIWKNVNIGDEVITSSMDSIFPYGIKVGKVTKINNQENSNEILVKPYAKTLGDRYFYIYSKNDIASN